VVLVGDSDFINDGAAVQIQEIFGQRIVIPRNGNIAFAQALVDQFAGDPDLIKLRSRASAARPFVRIRDMEARAQQRTSARSRKLEDNLGQTQEKLNALQKEGARGRERYSPPSSRIELENFRRRAAETRLALKEVRREAALGERGAAVLDQGVNIALMPLLVAIAGIAFAALRRRRPARA